MSEEPPQNDNYVIQPDKKHFHRKDEQYGSRKKPTIQVPKTVKKD